MERDSPFAHLEEPRDKMKSRIVHVNFCQVCHYVWKAPSAAINCINCKNPGRAISLVSYETEATVL